MKIQFISDEAQQPYVFESYDTASMYHILTALLHHCDGDQVKIKVGRKIIFEGEAGTRESEDKVLSFTQDN